jgi:hypothetical protein
MLGGVLKYSFLAFLSLSLIILLYSGVRLSIFPSSSGESPLKCAILLDISCYKRGNRGSDSYLITPDLIPSRAALNAPCYISFLEPASSNWVVIFSNDPKAIYLK